MNYDKIFDAKPRCLWEDDYIIDVLRQVKSKAPNKNVLDIASGTGRFPRKVFGTRYVALDQDPKMLALNYAQEKVLGDYSLMKSQSDKFGLATFFFGNIRNFAHLSEILTDTRNLLVDGGKVLAVIYAKGRKDSFVYPSLYEWGDFTMFTKSEIVRACAYSGLEINSLQGLTASVWDLFENKPNFHRFAMNYLNKGIGDTSIKWLRWHYYVLEATKL
jgi:SAM-dependent methyltransferase